MKTLSFNQFIAEYKPVKQNSDRTYRKYFIVNDLKASTLYKLVKTYNCNIFTGVQEDNILKLYPGRRYSLDNSFFIVVENAWDDYDTLLLVDVKKKK
jgi:hypothetical protein